MNFYSSSSALFPITELPLQAWTYQMDEERCAAVQALLMKAWRERWADFQWSTKLKQYIIPGVVAEANQVAGLLYVVLKGMRSTGKGCKIILSCFDLFDIWVKCTLYF